MKRMNSIGIKLECSSNYPWIYLDSVNGMRVTEKRFSEHKFTLGIETDGKMFHENLKDVFVLLRKYKNLTKIKK